MEANEDPAKEIAQLDAEIAALKKDRARYANAGNAPMTKTVTNQISALQRLREQAIARSSRK